MALLGELAAGMPWGLLVIADDETAEPGPEFAEMWKTVATASTVFVPVIHAAEGVLTVRVWSEFGDPRQSIEAFRGSILVESGKLRVGSADRQLSFVIEMKPGRRQIKVSVDEDAEPTNVDIWLADWVISESGERACLEIAEAFPELQPLYAEHLEDYGDGGLPHLFYGDVTRWAEQLTDPKTIRRFTRFIERQYASGDFYTRNLIYVSLLENLNPHPLMRRCFVRLNRRIDKENP